MSQLDVAKILKEAMAPKPPMLHERYAGKDPDENCIEILNITYPNAGNDSHNYWWYTYDKLWEVPGSKIQKGKGAFPTKSTPQQARLEALEFISQHTEWGYEKIDEPQQPAMQPTREIERAAGNLPEYVGSLPEYGVSPVQAAYKKYANAWPIDTIVLQDLDHEYIESTKATAYTTGLSALPWGAVQQLDDGTYATAVVDTRPAIKTWSLHTLKGVPVLKLQCTGERYYKVGELVSHDDFKAGGIESQPSVKIPAGPHKWLGKITAAYVNYQNHFSDGAPSSTNPATIVVQNIEIAIEKHSLITSGHYKLKGVIASEQKHPAATQQAATCAQPAKIPAVNAGVVVGITPPSQVPGKARRKFQLDD